ncbi:MAG: SufE family protein [Gammaproteobacteria bacterium]|nr:SufE family protein [Gammaproteobacteria bacterium]
MSEIAAAEREVIDEFSVFDNWMERYEYLIDLGRRLPALPESYKTDDNLLRGCQSRVWLQTRIEGERLHFLANSDSAIVAGLIAVLMRVYDGRRAAEILATPPTFVAAIGLDAHLSPTRSNGLRAMLQAINRAAAAVPGAS